MYYSFIFSYPHVLVCSELGRLWQYSCEFPLPPNMFFKWLFGWPPDTRPQSQRFCRAHFLCCAGRLRGRHSDRPLRHYSTSPFIKASLAAEILSVHLPRCIPFFPLSMKSKTKIIFCCQVAVNCDREGRVTGGLYAQPDLPRCQYMGAPMDKNGSTFWPGRSRLKLFSDVKGFQLRPHLEPFHGYVFY